MQRPAPSPNPEAAPGADEASRVPFALLLILFPLALGLAGQPAVSGLLLVAFGCVAFRFGCLKPFLATLGAALLLSLCCPCILSLYDVESYLAPQVRLLAGTPPDGEYSALHCLLPRGLALYGAALARLTGSFDLGASAFWIWAVAAWVSLRPFLSRLQCLLFLLSPTALISCASLMPDGCVYFLLLIALFSAAAPTAHPRAPLERFWLPLAALSVACTCKVSAWIPALLIGGLLLLRFPRRWWQLLLLALLLAAFNFSTLRLILSGNLAHLSSDFLSAAPEARTMGYFARLAYVYLGHWTAPAAPASNVPVLSADGASADALGPLFRLILWSGLLLGLCLRRRLRGWGPLYTLAVLSLLPLPTHYIGYARYTPLLSLVGLLPWILLLPRLACLPAFGLLPLPLAYLGWRLFLSTEAIAVFTHATAIHSPTFNTRATFCERLAPTPQATPAGNLLYTYTFPEPTCFPSLARASTPGLRTQTFSQKGLPAARHLFCQWLPWILRHAPAHLVNTLRFRFHAFRTRLRGAAPWSSAP